MAFYTAHVIVYRYHSIVSGAGSDTQRGFTGTTNALYQWPSSGGLACLPSIAAASSGLHPVQLQPLQGGQPCPAAEEDPGH